MNPLPTERVIKDLLKHQKKSFKTIAPESVAAYQFIQKRYNEGKTDDPLFRFVYCEFYQISDRFTNAEWREKYFNHFRDADLRSLLETLRLPNGKLQFSYVTKLLHTVDPTRPIYDSLVAKAARLPQYVGKNRTDYYVKTYERLKAIHAALLADKRVEKMIAALQRKHPGISSGKALDFLLWALGKVV